MCKRMMIFLILSIVKLTGSTMIAICDEKMRYEYDIEECPGGIQIRNVDRWFSKSRDKTCICGEGSMLQFDGQRDYTEYVSFPPGMPSELYSTLGRWHDYNLTRHCELIQGSDYYYTPFLSPLFINSKKYENPANFPTKAVELSLENFQEDRVAGQFKIAMTSGHNRRHNAKLWQLARNIIVNIQEPILVVEDRESDFKEHLCAYSPNRPEVLLTRYIETTWGNQDLVQNCEKKLYKPYNRTSYICPIKCETFTKYESPTVEKEQPIFAFRQFMLTMAEIAIRMKYSEKFVTFIYKDHPYAAILQNSCRVFHRAFPTVVPWETLMNAVTLFGVAFEGLVPSHMDINIFDQMKIVLGRCTLQERRLQKEHSQLLNEVCPSAMEMKQNSSINATIVSPDSDGEPSGNLKQQYNIVVELLWKVVQFTHASCMASSDHYPNIHHAYANAMMDLFSAPAVQLIWYQEGKLDYKRLGRAMIHIFPELSNHQLALMDLILKKLKEKHHLNVLQRPIIPDLDTRDMRCAGHGKLIWGGKACCYLENDDKKYYYFNKVAFAML